MKDWQDIVPRGRFRARLFFIEAFMEISGAYAATNE